MAKRVTLEDIENFNNLYYKNHNYSETARISGFSPSTVKKYIIPNYTKKENLTITKFDPKDIPESVFFDKLFDLSDWSSWKVLSEKEKEKLEELKKEVAY